MKFLLDENIDVRLAALLTDAGHDVTAVAHDYRYGLQDREVLAIARTDVNLHERCRTLTRQSWVYFVLDN